MKKRGWKLYRSPNPNPGEGEGGGGYESTIAPKIVYPSLLKDMKGTM